MVADRVEPGERPGTHAEEARQSPRSADGRRITLDVHAASGEPGRRLLRGESDHRVHLRDARGRAAESRERVRSERPRDVHTGGAAPDEPSRGERLRERGDGSVTHGDDEEVGVDRARRQGAARRAERHGPAGGADRAREGVTHLTGAENVDPQR